ncbi:hypothetical protein HK405_011676, partial [Cladochytrium tenue]
CSSPLFSLPKFLPNGLLDLLDLLFLHPSFHADLPASLNIIAVDAADILASAGVFDIKYISPPLPRFRMNRTQICLQLCSPLCADAVSGAPDRNGRVGLDSGAAAAACGNTWRRVRYGATVKIGAALDPAKARTGRGGRSAANNDNHDDEGYVATLMDLAAMVAVVRAAASNHSEIATRELTESCAVRS